MATRGYVNEPPSGRWPVRLRTRPPAGLGSGTVRGSSVANGLAERPVAASLVEPRWAVLLAGVGWLCHGVWDAYHFVQNKIVNRPWSEFCTVVDVVVDPALIVVALTM
ncbi:MAG: hypothetical protein ACRDT6_17355 [Micromonosporaceae bacterium]